MITLRDMKPSDIQDNMRWFTTETEWTYWDCPSEKFEAISPALELMGWQAYYEDMKDLPQDSKRWKFEIDDDDRHIGWISSYEELAYCQMKEGAIGMGMGIPAPADRNRGAGTQAVKLFMDYLRGFGHRCFYMETWTGNEPMLAVARKLGFREIHREEGMKTVDGKPYAHVTLMLEE